jgi:hypothetical protein
MAELYFRQNVDDGLKELDEGKGVSHEEAKKRLNRWLKYNKPDLRELVYQNYRIIYRVRTGLVEIVWITHGLFSIIY